MKRKIPGVIRPLVTVCCFAFLAALPFGAQAQGAQSTTGTVGEPQLPNTQAQDWRQKSVVLRCEKSTLERALDQVSTQANVSIILDGIAPSKPFTLNAQLPAEKALTQIAEAFDCSWSVSQSGIVLLRKRFTDEHERPQVAPAEMLAALHDILAFLRIVYPKQSNQSLSRSFADLEAILPPDALRRFYSEQGLPIYTLAPRQQQQAIQIIYQEQLNTAGISLDRFERQLAALSTSTLQTENIVYAGGSTFSYAVLRFAPASGLERVLLCQVSENSSPPTSALTYTVTSSEAAQTVTLALALAAVEKRFALKIIPPAMSEERRLLLKLREGDAPRLPAALAELYGWTVREDSAHGYTLLRKPAVTPASVMEWGKAIQEALPADVAHWLSMRPATLNDKPYVNPEELFPQLPKTSGFTMSVIDSKMYVQLRESQDALQRAIHNNNMARARPFHMLTPELQQEIVCRLFYSAMTQAHDGLLPFIFHVPNRIADPLHARLSRTGLGFRITGAGGGMVEVSESR